MAWNRRILIRYVLVGVVLPGIFFGSGWAVLSLVDGWFGIILWMLASVPLCFLVEFVMRTQRPPRRSAKSLPRMRVRTPLRGDRGRAIPRHREEDFDWHDERSARRRRSHVR